MRNPALYYFVGVILVTLVVTVLVLRHRIARRQKSFFLAALVSTVSANAILFVAVYLVGRFYTEGWHTFTLEAWRSDNGSLHNLESAISDAMIFTLVGTLICILPTFGVAYYYERQSKRNEKDVA